jgi:hypothetical protein
MNLNLAGGIKMKINDKILSVPPYISTCWSYVKSLQMKGPFLVITLMGGESINIPNLKGDIIEQIFNAHAAYMENNLPLAKMGSNPLEPSLESAIASDVSLKFGIGSIDGINGNPLVHNPAQSDAPEIPKEILQKIAAIAKIISPEDLTNMPKAELHCNCLHCQIVRTINTAIEPAHHPLQIHEESVNDEELKFQQWEITQTGDKLFNVINRLDTQEKYSVYLGHPIGCTCGQKSCEHIVAVLKS